MIAQVNYFGAVELLDGLPSGVRGYQETREKMIEQWANADPHSLLEWAKDRDDDKERSASIGKALSSLAIQSPQEAGFGGPAGL